MKLFITTLTLLLMQNLMNAQFTIDKLEYPFQSHFFNTPNGKMHYVDEGKGDVMLFVHGTPTWSFLYRNYIKEFSKNHRCIAIDHLGFGLSDKPNTFVGTPEAHAKNLALFIDSLKLKNITLVVHDFGGPIGLSYAINNISNIKKVVMFNTWLWETKTDKEAIKVDKILHSKAGNWIYLNTNFSPKMLLKKAFHNKKKLTKNNHKHYYKIFNERNKRYGLLNIGKSLLGSSDWYAKLWENAQILKQKPILFLWGSKDPFIGMDKLQMWKQKFTNAKYQVFEAGHFVQEEQPQQSIDVIKSFLDNN